MGIWTKEVWEKVFGGSTDGEADSEPTPGEAQEDVAARPKSKPRVKGIAQPLEMTRKQR